MRPAAAGAVLGLALAIGAPTAWSLTRPSASAGAPVEQVLGGRRRAGPSSSPMPTPTVPRPAVPPGRRPRARGGRAGPGPARGPRPRGRQPPSTRSASSRRRPDGHPGRRRPGRLVPVRPGARRRPGRPCSPATSTTASRASGALAPLRERRGRRRDRWSPTPTGTTTRWRVVSRELITKQVLPLDRLFARTGPPRLTLITCGGPFLPEFRSYRDNVVVVAEPVR